MTPRGTDWSLALLVSLGFLSGVLTLFAGSRGHAWVFAAHAIVGASLGLILGWKLRRVWRRLRAPRHWDGRTVAGAASVALVAGTLGSGWVWSGGGDASFGGYNVLNWHFVLGAALAAVVLAHAVVRAKRPRARDLADRRQFLQAAAVGALAVGAWQLQRPFSTLAGWRGARRRFTGSYEAASFAGNEFPSTSWVADDPREIGGPAYRLTVAGLVRRRLALRVGDLDARDSAVATLDCTGGFYSRQRWRGVSLGRLIDRSRPLSEATHVRVISHTGYRWSFPLAEAGRLLLATMVGGEPLSHEHGAPVRLVAPGRRGFEWVKWVTRIEIHDGPDAGAAPSTVWSSFTPEGRGRA
jgi:DMSO/TMAO reductase YedYZ molybdopterin-dependent catalytic subunit